VFLGDCARFDRVAAEAVRTQAASPSYSHYSAASRSRDVQSIIELAFYGNTSVSITVSVSEAGFEGGTDEGTGSDGVGFSLLPRQEVYTCTMNYRPWMFRGSFFGIQFSGISHTRQYVIDPYRPGVFL